MPSERSLASAITGEKAAREKARSISLQTCCRPVWMTARVTGSMSVMAASLRAGADDRCCRRRRPSRTCSAGLRSDAWWQSICCEDRRGRSMRSHAERQLGRGQVDAAVSMPASPSKRRRPAGAGLAPRPASPRRPVARAMQRRRQVEVVAGAPMTEVLQVDQHRRGSPAAATAKRAK